MLHTLKINFDHVLPEQFTNLRRLRNARERVISLERVWCAVELVNDKVLHCDSVCMGVLRSSPACLEFIPNDYSIGRERGDIFDHAGNDRVESAVGPVCMGDSQVVPCHIIGDPAVAPIDR